MGPKKIGILGEKIAQEHLKNKGYQILDRNYSFRIPGSPQKGEIDIVVKKEDTIHFIEVKTLRNRATLIQPEEKVNFRKQRKIMKTAESWLMKKKLPLNSKWQIDVISIKIDPSGKRAKIRHFENIAVY